MSASVLWLKVDSTLPASSTGRTTKRCVGLVFRREMAFVALITGASSGIGEAAARRLSRELDVKLILVARREEKLRELADSVGGATVMAVDLTSADAPVRVRETV